MQKKSITLNNGLKIVLMSKEVYTVNSAIVVKTGMLNETDDENGISHFLEHMAFKGTKNKTAKELIEYIEYLGGNTNAFTSNDKTCYTVSLPDQYWKESCDFLCDIVRNSIFPEDELEKERNVIIQEYKQTNDDPNYVSFSNLLKLGFKGHRQSRTVLGTLENIQKFNQANLIKYYKKHYVPNNMIFAMVIPEKYNLDEVSTYISNLFSDFEKGEDEIIEKTKIICSDMAVVYKSGIEQSYISMGMPGVRLDSKFKPVFDVLTTIFDGGMSTRLFQTMREKLGLTYQTYSFKESSLASNLFGIFSIVEPKNEDKAIKEIKNVFSTMCTSITDAELEKAKNMLKYSFATMNEGGKMMDFIISDMFYLNKEFNYDETLNALMNVTKEDIMKLAKMMIQNEFTVLVVRPENSN